MKLRIHIVATGMLVLMMLSITPKTFLHDVFANHTDVTACNDSNLRGPCIHSQGYNCNQTELIVPSVYTHSEVSLNISATFADISFPAVTSPILQNFNSSFTGRGPPHDV